MNASSRTAQFSTLHKVLKKHYKPYSPDSGRTVLDHLLFACCLEEASHDAAEEAFAALVHTFFDWNEVRVTSVSELSEVMSSLPDPRGAANRIKRALHSIFEETFAFDLEDCRKKNLGPTVAWLNKLDGTTPFTVAYVVQAALGGHAIPIDDGSMSVLRVLDLVDEKDAAAGNVPGLERAIPKSKGIEFGSLLHELGANYAANPYGAAIREFLLSINPDCKNRLTTWRAKRNPGRTEEKAPPEQPAAPAADPPTAEKPKTAKTKEAARPEKTPRVRAKKTKPESPRITKKSAPAKKSPAQADVPKKRASSKGIAKRKPR